MNKTRVIDRLDSLLWILLIVFTASQNWKVALLFVAAFAIPGALEVFWAQKKTDTSQQA